MKNMQKKIRTEKLSLEKVMGIFDRNPEFKKMVCTKVCLASIRLYKDI